jgi:methyl-accepting chemotaxis protein
VVSAAKVEAERSGQVVRQAREAMGGIEDSSEHIAQTIGVIDEIAFQTNLLALSAGVEAARSPEPRSPSCAWRRARRRRPRSESKVAG